MSTHQLFDTLRSWKDSWLECWGWFRCLESHRTSDLILNKITIQTSSYDIITSDAVKDLRFKDKDKEGQRQGRTRTRQVKDKEGQGQGRTRTRKDKDKDKAGQGQGRTRTRTRTFLEDNNTDYYHKEVPYFIQVLGLQMMSASRQTVHSHKPGGKVGTITLLLPALLSWTASLPFWSIPNYTAW